MPQFRRSYEIVLDGGFTVSVEIGYWSLGRRDSAELRQRNGKWILFDIDAIADKIIDRDLYPLVQVAVNEIMEIDKAFRRSNPNTFTDEQGVVWRRAGERETP